MSKPKGKTARQFKQRTNLGDKSREFLKNIDENSPIIQQFRLYSQELDEKNDRHERIVKQSRDITIESKRIIFLLHTVQMDMETKRENVLQEAKTRLEALINANFRTIAVELRDYDANLYHRAYTNGMQEFIEACCYYNYLINEEINSFDQLNAHFSYKDAEFRDFVLDFSMYDYILGIADFTGELMRRCINTLGSGNVNDCFKLCNYVKDINTGYLGVIVPGNREISHKGHTLRQSLLKMELVCYNIRIRGSEIPKHMLVNVIESNEMQNEDDEGFF